MNNQNIKTTLAVAFILLGIFVLLFYQPHHEQAHTEKTASGKSESAESTAENKNSDGANTKTLSDTGDQRKTTLESNLNKNSDATVEKSAATAFPINAKIELPFIGVVPCHMREEQVEFEGNGKRLKWPFKLYYLANGMFVRAEFVKSGAINMYDEKANDPLKKDVTIIHEAKPKDIEIDYEVSNEKLIGFPDKAAPASLSVVLKYLYDNEPFDDATKIDITWVLRKYRKEEIKPCFIANIYGVSSGGMLRVPDEEKFKRYRILLTPAGVGWQQDNLL